MVFNIQRLPTHENGKEQILEGMNIVEQTFVQSVILTMLPRNNTIVTPPKIAQLSLHKEHGAEAIHSGASGR